MQPPTVTAVFEPSAAWRAGIEMGDEIVSINGQRPRDVIEFHQLVDAEEIEMLIDRAGLLSPKAIFVKKPPGSSLGIEVSSAVFDRVRTCDNRCPFCFIHQLPVGMRKSLYVRDDDYRLSFLYGNFTTLTRFTELDAERVIDEHLSPLFVSIHATDPEVRARMLKNPRGATSLRWLKVLLENDIEVHGQVVVCPGVNDGEVLEETCRDVLDEYPTLSSVGVVPLGLSRFSKDSDMRLHTSEDAIRVLETVERFQSVFLEALGRRTVFAADEYYLLAGRSFPSVGEYEGFPQHENGIGMATEFMAAFSMGAEVLRETRTGFFQSVDGAPAIDYRAIRTLKERTVTGESDVSRRRVSILTGSYGKRILTPLLAREGFEEVTVVEVENEFFGGNIAVAGLLCGEDVAKTVESHGRETVFLLPDNCLSNGRFLDGVAVDELPYQVQVVPAEGGALRRVLEATRSTPGRTRSLDVRPGRSVRRSEKNAEVGSEQSV